MTTKYYHAENAGRMIAGIMFSIYGITSGVAYGVYATDDEAQQKELDALVAGKKDALTHTTQDAYESALKKKPPTHNFNSSPPLRPPPTPPGSLTLGGHPIKGPAGTVVNEPSPPAEDPTVEIPETIQSPEDALQLGQVKTPEQTEAAANAETPKPEAFTQ